MGGEWHGGGDRVATGREGQQLHVVAREDHGVAPLVDGLADRRDEALEVRLGPGHAVNGNDVPRRTAAGVVTRDTEPDPPTGTSERPHRSQDVKGAAVLDDQCRPGGVNHVRPSGRAGTYEPASVSPPPPSPEAPRGEERR